MIKKKKILITTSEMGHKSIADAISSELADSYQVQTLFHAFTPYNYLYFGTYKYLPQVYSASYRLIENEPSLCNLIKKTCKKKSLGLIKKSYQEFQPDLIISTFFAYNEALKDFCLGHQIPLINIITDPRTILPLLFNDQAINCLFDQKALKIAYKNHIPEDKTLVTGWFTHSKFYQEKASTNLYKKFNFDKKVFTILICGGSGGMTGILKVIPVLFNPPKKIQVVIVCGKSQTIHKTALAIKTLTAQLPNKMCRQFSLKILGFTKYMPELMHLADIVVGKAGPNLLFESVASGKPFLAIAHIPGQERGNLEIIKEYQLGYVEENALKATKLLKRIISQPKILYRFKKPIQELCQKNQNAKTILREKIEDLLNHQSLPNSLKTNIK